MKTVKEKPKPIDITWIMLAEALPMPSIESLETTKTNLSNWPKHCETK